MSSPEPDSELAFFTNGSAPDQPATVLHQESVITFPSLPKPCLLAVDASPGCGGIVWPAGTILCEYLLHVLESQPEFLVDKEILELGSGTGLVGLVLGIKEPRCRVTITDQEVLLALMKENVKLNELDNVKAAVLDWGEDALPVGIPPKQDILLLADCVYFEPAFPLLVTTLLLLTGDPQNQPLIYFAYKKRRRADRLFFQQLSKHFVTAPVEDDPNRGVYERQGLKLMMITRKVKPVQAVKKIRTQVTTTEITEPTTQ